MKTQRRKEIFANESGFNGYNYRVMHLPGSKRVTIQRNYHNGYWYDRKTIDLYEYEQWLDATAHNRSNPALLARLAGD